MAKRFPSYSDYKSEVVSCRCGNWTGKVAEAYLEVHRELIDYHCPLCDEIVAIICDPTEQEVRDAAAAGIPVAIETLSMIEKTKARNEEARGMALQSPDQLPEIEGDRLILHWDLEDKDGESYVVLTCKGAFLWRELAFWEGWERFNDVKETLKARYGARFAALSPSDQSEFWLYGDDHSAMGKVKFT